MPRLIRAAGGVVFQRTGKGRIKVLVTHRPLYDDWSLPKGKADRGESAEETAVREVLEETGYRCRVIAPIGKTRYRVGSGNKEVTWYAMRPLPDSPGFRSNAEVDKVRWLSLKKATARLDYERDRELIGGTDFQKLARTGTLFLVRHAVAGDRSKWSDEDRHRPLTKSGHRQARAISNSLAGRGVDRIVSSPFDRCVQTVTPLAKLSGAKIEESALLAPEAPLDEVWGLVETLIGHNAVLCTHGEVLTPLMNRLMAAGLSLTSRFYCSKGSTWEVEVDGGKFTTGIYVPPPDK